MMKAMENYYKQGVTVKEIHGSISYPDRIEQFNSVVLLIPHALRYAGSNELEDLFVGVEDKDGNDIEFSTVVEAQDWLNKNLERATIKEYSDCITLVENN